MYFHYFYKISAPSKPMLSPVCQGENIVIGEKDDIGIITLWTKKEAILKHLNPNQYGFVGQLYSKDEGISYLLRNCLANKSIRHLILVGVDLYNSGEALSALMKNGTENHKIVGVNNAIIHKEIPEEAINSFRTNITLHDNRDLRNFAKIQTILNTISPSEPYGNNQTFPEHKIEGIESYPTDPVGFKIVDKTIGQAWLQILDTIMKFGVKKKTEYNNEMKELINVMAVITDEHPTEIRWEPFFNFSREDLEKYIPQILTDLKIRDVEYTYGTRLREHFGKDQIQEVINYLKETPYTRRAVAVTWDVKQDLRNTKAPCLDLLQFIVQENKLYLIVYFRSNDMFDAWPRNAFALRRLQGNVAKEIGVELGSLTTLSCSAHIYNSCWELSNNLIQKHKHRPQLEFDPRGNIVITIKDNQIYATQFSPEGGKIGETIGKTAKDILNSLQAKKSISTISHALYLGRELQKAEIALQKNIQYQQDRPLLL
jgi:thymidylate synthase